MGQIVLLDELTINKIAAGEVVDRPASIVKELIENSIDAGAKNITIDIKNGGISYIKIKDDGKGFKADDVEIAFERHATSKIRSEDDIQKVISMGFRGEALASIAAISNVELITRNIDESVGTKTVVEAGTILSSQEFASAQGTSIVVRNIFFNVPARYKFLKKDYKEAGYIEEVIIKLALINPQISFKFNNNGKSVIATTGNGDIRTAIYNIFGKNYANSTINVDTEYLGIHVYGVMGTPNNNRSNRSHQYFYVNKRYVKNKTLYSAIDQGYNENMAIGKFAFCVLNVEMPTMSVDVNVHPAKLEVKFENENLVFSAVNNAIRSSLLKYNTENTPFTTVKEEEKSAENKVNEIITNIKKEEYVTPTYENVSILNKVITNLEDMDKVVEPVKENIREEYIPQVAVPQITKQPEIRQEATREEYTPPVNIPQIAHQVEQVNEVVNEVKREEYIPEIVEQPIREQATIALEPTIQIQTPKVEIAYKYRGTIFNTYPIVEIGEKVYIIDQHAAHERLLYEKVKEIYLNKEKTIQMLLLPLIVELTNYEVKTYESNKEVFERTGYIVESFGENALKIVGVPNINYEIDYTKMFLDILDEINGTNKTEKSEKEFRFLATVACKAAIKANTNYTEIEYKHLIDEMMKLDRPFTCPHGRPTAYELSKYEIERRFLRK